MNPFPNKTYDIIYADPPWSYYGGVQHNGVSQTSVVEDHYPSMTIEELCEMNVENIANPNSLLYLWTTGPHLANAMMVIDAWDFDYKQVFKVWDKVITNPGNYCLTSCEFLLVGKRKHGKIPKEVSIKGIRQMITERRTQHSRKPECARNDINKLFPTANKIELFARNKTNGWDVWGNETDKFSNNNDLLSFDETA